MPRDKEVDKAYYLRNKERIAKQSRERYQRNKEKMNNKSKEYRTNNPDKRKITQWKAAGMIDADWPSVYEMFIKEKECWICGINFNETKRTKCLEHNHDTGELRYVCCSTCNLQIVG